LEAARELDLGLWGFSSRQAVSFDHEKTNDRELVLRRPFVGRRADKMPSLRFDTNPKWSGEL
jgi:hypothetical protein